jgi:hypothetical protein
MEEWIVCLAGCKISAGSESLGHVIDGLPSHDKTRKEFAYLSVSEAHAEGLNKILRRICRKSGPRLRPRQKLEFTICNLTPN